MIHKAFFGGFLLAMPCFVSSLNASAYWNKSIKNYDPERAHELWKSTYDGVFGQVLERDRYELFSEMVEKEPRLLRDYQLSDGTYGSTISQVAALGAIKIMSLLLAVGDKKVITLCKKELVTAIMNEQVGIIALIAKEHDKLNELDSAGFAPIHWAFMCSSSRGEDMVRVLLEAGADIDMETQNGVSISKFWKQNIVGFDHVDMRLDYYRRYDVIARKYARLNRARAKKHALLNCAKIIKK